MHVETQRFIDSLYSNVQQDPPVFLTLTAIHPDGSHPTPSRHVPLGNQRGLELAMKRLVVANERGWGAYIGVAPRVRDLGRWSRGTRQDLTTLPALYIDVDINVDNPDDLMFRLMRFDLAPSCIVSSGNGYHVYWYLSTPTRDFAAADDILHRLAGYFNSDQKMTVAQSMRLPGTYNTKPGRERALCQIVMFHPDWRYSLRDLAVRLPQPPTQQKQHKQQRPIRHWAGAEIPSQHRREVIDAVTEAVIQQLDGVLKPNGWIAARCPGTHCRDKPGMHFSYQPENGIGYCFGKHGKISLDEMCNLLGIVPVR